MPHRTVNKVRVLLGGLKNTSLLYVRQIPINVSIHYSTCRAICSYQLDAKLVDAGKPNLFMTVNQANYS